MSRYRAPVLRGELTVAEAPRRCKCSETSSVRLRLAERDGAAGFGLRSWR
jgi:hypothetical protein